MVCKFGGTRWRMAHLCSVKNFPIWVHTCPCTQCNLGCFGTWKTTFNGAHRTATWGPRCRNRRPYLTHRDVANDATKHARWASVTSWPTHGRDTGTAHPAASATLCPPHFLYSPTNVGMLWKCIKIWTETNGGGTSRTHRSKKGTKFLYEHGPQTCLWEYPNKVDQILRGKACLT